MFVNPEDWFSRVAAHIILILIKIDIFMPHNTNFIDLAIAY